MKETEFGFFRHQPTVTAEGLLWKESTKADTKKYLEEVVSILKMTNFDSSATIKERIIPYAEKEGKGNVLWPLRVALSGQEKSIDPFTICFVLGLEEAIIRIEKACSVLTE